MRLLLDTHIFLWWMDDAPQLEERLRAEIADPKNEVFLSSVVIWEITIKSALGKLEIARDWFEAAKKEPFSRLSIRIMRIRSDFFPIFTEIPLTVC